MIDRRLVFGGIAGAAIVATVVVVQARGSDNTPVGASTAVPSGTGSIAPSANGGAPPTARTTPASPTSIATTTGPAGATVGPPTDADTGAVDVPGSAEFAAAHYVSAAYGLDYRWADIGQWVEGTKAYDAPAYYAQIAAARAAAKQAGDAGDAQAWADAKASLTVTRVRVSRSTVILAAPVTATSKYVRVAYTTNTITESDTEGQNSIEQTINVMMSKSTGAWLVAGVSTSGQ